MRSERPLELDRLVDHLFRRESGRLVGRLVRVIGPRHLELAEEAVQDAMVQALRTWPFRGIPDDPSAWLSRVARNRALDVLRRGTSFDAKRGEIVALLEARLEREREPGFAAELEDDTLRLIFTCCHPVLKGDVRVALTLKTVCGFSVSEIARAFLAKEPTIAQRLVRAKRTIAERGLPYAVPEPGELPARLASVHKVLYLMFNEGYSPGTGDEVIRADICQEATRLAEALAAHPVTGGPESHALAALLLLQGCRLTTRQDGSGAVLLLEDQDRGAWNRDWIHRGLGHLRRSMTAERLTPFHLEAGIAACHAGAATWEATDWDRILEYYDRRLELAPPPVRRLNRAVAVAMVAGPDTALDSLRPLADEPSLGGYYLLPATVGEMYRRLGRVDEARAELGRAL
ncbi:MAG: DUF6596 domain-containing protein, partial [Thermoanaerobaculia bacterium]|nr:DUF6596 domain-containing protein [Thermoanaerobaculia bacterium]